ncbi:UNVERIFIED_CONTAM: hypothetical protein NCL1_29808 [Trichonephila clavipes]
MKIVVHVLLLAGKSSFVSKYNENTSSFLFVVRRTPDFVTRAIVRIGHYLSHCSCKIELISKLSDHSDDNNATNKTYEMRILEGESSSDESDEENRWNI